MAAAAVQVELLQRLRLGVAARGWPVRVAMLREQRLELPGQMAVWPVFLLAAGLLRQTLAGVREVEPPLRVAAIMVGLQFWVEAAGPLAAAKQLPQLMQMAALAVSRAQQCLMLLPVD